MNILVDDLPYFLEVDDKEYEINTDFKTCLKIIMAFEDDDLTQHEKIYITLELLYKEIPSNLEKAFEKAVLFLNLGENDGENTKKRKKRLYSFTQDSKYIFTAIDGVTDGKLSKGMVLHWWLFCMAFMEVSEHSFFSKIVYLRTQKRKGKLTKEEKVFWNENRDILELAGEVSEKEKATEEEIRNMEEFDRKLKEAQERKKKLKEVQKNGL